MQWNVQIELVTDGNDHVDVNGSLGLHLEVGGAREATALSNASTSTSFTTQSSPCMVCHARMPCT